MGFNLAFKGLNYHLGHTILKATRNTFISVWLQGSRQDSRQGSRQGSRQDSRQGSRQGSRHELTFVQRKNLSQECSKKE
jgi:hypothetical protein